MMHDGLKENANPTIIHVEKDSFRSSNTSKLWSAISDRTRDEETDGLMSNNINSENRSILQALQDVSDATDGRGVTLLVNSGLTLKQANNSTAQTTNFSSNDAAALDFRNQLLHREMINEHEVFNIIRNIQDPEHPLTLEQLGVVSRQQVGVNYGYDDQGLSTIDVRFTPTIPHCSMATLIGLCIRVKLLRSLPSNDRFKVTVRIEPGTHNSESAVNKQLADKERVCAALENKHLLSLVDKCIASGMKLGNF
jgi:metal-sulfur cluster biosynthetic enzyme